MKPLTIGQVARSVGIGVETVRFYEREGLLTILDMNDRQAARQSKALGVRSVPAVVINGELADCCKGGALNEPTLRGAGIGQPLA